MRAVATRTISVTGTAINIRGSNLLPVTYTRIRYAGGGATVELVPLSSSAYGDGETVPADTDFQDNDQSIARYVVGSAAGPTSLRVTDYQA